jgi:predicted nuclease of predicted toxin-antitoxin system
MKIVADESVDRQIVDQLRKDGHTVFSVSESEPSIDDKAVLDRANEHVAVLVTADKDFGELVYRQGLIHQGVVLIRLAGLAPDKKAQIVGSVIRKRESELAFAFSVIGRGTVRIRKGAGLI